MSERQAALCSFHEYELRIQGRQRAARLQWEMTRWQVWQLLSPNYKRGHEPKTPQEFCRFEWEKSTEQEAIEAFTRTRITDQEQDWLDSLTQNNIEN